MRASPAPLGDLDESELGTDGIGSDRPAPQSHERPPLELRRAAEELDATHGVATKVAPIWREVLCGGAAIVDWFYTPTRWYVVYVKPEQDGRWKPVSARVRKLFDTLLLGQSQKRAAFDHGVGNSTISVTFHRALEQLGVPLTPCKAPPVLALFARAGLGLKTPVARHCSLVTGARTYEVVSVERPEVRLCHMLPPAEHEVLCGIIEGRTYAEIAGTRRTSVRTVANQVRSIFQRFQVSGRAELVAKVLELASSTP